MLYFLKKWDFQEAFQLFNVCKAQATNDKFWYYGILSDAADYDAQWVINNFRSNLMSRADELKPFSDKFEYDHKDDKLLEKLVLMNAEAAFNLIYEVVSVIIERTTYPSSFCALNENSTFWLFDSTRGNVQQGPDALLYLQINELRKYARTDSSRFIRIYNLLITSDSITIIQSLIHGLLNAPEKYCLQIVNLLDIVNKKKAISGSGKIDYWLRRLLAVSYELFTEEQRKTVNEIIISIRPDHEVEIYELEGIKHHRLQFYGYTQYQYLSSIPLAQIKGQPMLKHLYMVLQRKFANQKEKDTEPMVVRLRPVPAPLSQQAYIRMNDDNWVQTFEKYNSDKYNSISNAGSMQEHSRAFAEQVKSKPDKFVGLIERIIEEDKVPHAYIVKGIEGLVDGDYDPVKLQVLYNKASLLDLDSEHTLYLIWKASYFIKHKIVNSETAGYLARMATTHPDPQETKGDALQHSANCVRGASTSRIVELFYNPQYSGLIFRTVEEVCNDRHQAVKVAALVRLAYLMNLDSQATLHLFLKLKSDSSEEVYKYSFWSAQYLLNYDFDALIPYLSRCLKVSGVEEDLAKILAAAWIGGKEKGLSLLAILVKKSKKAIAAAVQVASQNISDESPKIRERCTQLFNRFLNEEDEDVAHQYSCAFLHIAPARFISILPLLKKYSSSNVVRKSPRYFFEFLLKCVPLYPHACINLISSWKKYSNSEISKASYWDDEPIKIVIGAYNTLRDSNTDRKYKQKALVIFDNMLRDERFRASANKVIEQVEN